jgi:hypothetical protein
MLSINVMYEGIFSTDEVAIERTKQHLLVELALVSLGYDRKHE